jgi:hypothetical protein
MWIFGKEKGQPSEYGLALVAVCGGLDTAAYCLTSNGFGHLKVFCVPGIVVPLFRGLFRLAEELILSTQWLSWHF